MKHRTINSILNTTIIVALVVCAIVPSAFAKNKNRLFETDNPVIAKVGSSPITIAEIEDKQINDLRSQLYERLNQKLHEKGLEKLGKKFPEFAKEPDLNISDNTIKEFYKSNNLKNRGSFEQLAPQIKIYFESQVKSAHYKKLYRRAVNRGLIVSYLNKPNDFLVRVPVESAYLRGNRKARVMVLEFSDYQCPFCSRVQPTISRLRKKYKSKIVFGYRHAPLPFHQEADEAAIAVECARDQGKFEAYHTMLFDNYRNLSIANLKSFAKKTGIKDLKKFNDCLTRETYRKRLENDQQAAREAGIRGTPGFVIGRYDGKLGSVVGEVLSGAQPQNAFEEAIEKYLGK
ncbi:MAG: thioredoxin domain-containing protein [Proteobacteria bacterium]|nr:thioredoxin domain-containing protein [Pseudomonadota bacterium]